MDDNDEQVGLGDRVPNEPQVLRSQTEQVQHEPGKVQHPHAVPTPRPPDPHTSDGSQQLPNNQEKRTTTFIPIPIPIPAIKSDPDSDEDKDDKKDGEDDETEDSEEEEEDDGIERDSMGRRKLAIPHAGSESWLHFQVLRPLLWIAFGYSLCI